MNSDITNGFTQAGHFSGQYSIEITPYEGLDFSRRCFILPGQSSALPGMFNKSVAAEEALRERLEQGDTLARELGLPPISRYVTHPESLTSQELNRSKNPALFCIEVGMCEAIMARGIQPAVLTSHSFGEYAALVVSGIARFEDVFRIVVARDELSPPARQLGTMIAVNANQAAVEGALRGQDFFVCNLNSPNQTVISIAPGGFDKALAVFKKFKIAAKALLEMPQPYHSPLMERVGARLADFLENWKFEFKAPTIPLLSSVTGDLITSQSFLSLGGTSFVERLLARQVCEPVRFTSQIQKIFDLGILNFTEIGPIETCSLFVKETLGEKVFKISPLSRFIESEKVTKKFTRLSVESSGMLNKLSRVIASVTGYKVEEISIQDNFQEDLGIDSIRKAEIVFKFMESMKDPSQTASASQINLAQIRSLEDIIEHFEKEESRQKSDALQPRFERYTETWIPAPITDFERLSANDLDIENIRIFPLETLTADFHLEVDPRTLLILTAKRTENVDPDQAYEQTLLPLIRSLQSLQNQNRVRDLRIALVHEPGAHPASLALDGMFKCWFREDSIEAYRFVEVESVEDHQALEALVRADFLDSRFNVVRHAKGKRSAKIWNRSAESEAESLLQKPVILSIGGARGIGAAILEKIAEVRPQAKIVILGRSAKEKAADTVAKLSAYGCGVVYVQGDATDAFVLDEAIKVLCTEHGAIDLVLCGAGKELSRSLIHKTDKKMREEFDGKVRPATTLFHASHKYRLKRILNYSSIAAEFGNVGQSIYALGNRIMSGLGDRLNEAGLSRVTSLILPPWDNVGMTENPLILNALKAQGVTLLPKEAGAELVAREALSDGINTVAILDSNDVRAYDADLLDRQAAVDLFASAISTLKSIELPNLNRAQQPYLSDHIVKGNVIYPGSSALAMMFYAAYLYFRQIPVIENFEIVSFLAPHKNKSDVHLQIRRGEHGRLALQLASARAVHYRCEAMIESHTNFQGRAVNFQKDREIAPRPLYSSKNMVFGPHFQLAHELWFDESRNLLHLTRASQLTRYTGQTVFDRLQQWFESTLQAVGGQLLWQTQHQWVPLRIGRVAAHPNCRITDELHHQTEPVEKRGESWIMRAWTQNANGEPFFEMQNIEEMDLGRNQGAGQFFTRRSPEEPWSHEDIGM